MHDFLTALGLVLIIEGVPYFLVPDRMRAWIVKIAELPDGLLRQTGFVMMAIGLFLVYLVRGG